MHANFWVYSYSKFSHVAKVSKTLSEITYMQADCFTILSPLCIGALAILLCDSTKQPKIGLHLYFGPNLWSAFENRYHKIFKVPYSALHTIISWTNTALRMAALSSIRHAKKTVTWLMTLLAEKHEMCFWGDFPWPNSACLWHFVLPRKPVTNNSKTSGSRSLQAVDFQRVWHGPCLREPMCNLFPKGDLTLMVSIYVKQLFNLSHSNLLQKFSRSSCKAWNVRPFPWPNSACLWHFVLPRKPVTNNF